MVCLLAHWLPRLQEVMFWSSISAFVACLAAVLGMSKSKQSARVVFTQYQNETGWPDGLSFLIGLGTCMYMFSATDAATHIAEACLMTSQWLHLEKRLTLRRRSRSQAGIFPR